MTEKNMAKSKGSSFLSEDELDPASNAEQDQAHADRVTFAPHSMEMLLGGEMHDFGKGVGPVVGTPYDDDLMGEERTMVTYKGSRKSSRGDGASNDEGPIKTGKDKGMINGGVKK
jgi:hypothetical protein